MLNCKWARKPFLLTADTTVMYERIQTPGTALTRVSDQIFLPINISIIVLIIAIIFTGSRGLALLGVLYTRVVKYSLPDLKASRLKWLRARAPSQSSFPQLFPGRQALSGPGAAAGAGGDPARPLEAPERGPAPRLLPAAPPRRAAPTARRPGAPLLPHGAPFAVWPRERLQIVCRNRYKQSCKSNGW